MVIDIVLGSCKLMDFVPQITDLNEGVSFSAVHVHDEELWLYTSVFILTRHSDQVVLYKIWLIYG